MKKCPTCKIKLPKADFYSRKSGTLMSECKKCSNKRRKKWSKKYPEKVRAIRLKYTYGISLEDYDKLFEKQNGVCAICGKEETSKNQYGVRRLCVDHDHQTGKIRGLLCWGCNGVLGMVKDNENILFNAVSYLRGQN